MKNKFCDIAFPIPVHREFTYSVPEEFRDAVVKGVRVVASFRKKLMTGVVVGLKDESDLTEIKPISDVLDSEPVYSEEMMKLTKWISDYYLASWGEVLKSAMPAGMSVTSETVVTLLKDKFDEKNPTRRKILELLANKGPLTLKKLKGELGTAGLRYHLLKLASQNIVQLSEELTSPRAKIRYETYVDFTGTYKDSAALSTLLGELDRRAPKQAEILLTLSKMLHTMDSGVSAAHLLAQSHGSMASLKALAEKGIVEFYDQEELRLAEGSYTEEIRDFQLTDDQKVAVNEIVSSIERGEYRTFLLHGVTGSGKTQVYIEALDYALKLGKTGIVMVPEISLTPQIVHRFRARFKDQVVLMHSRMSIGERYDAWRTLFSGRAKVVIGARSAVFAPVKNLGLIIVDEEHESTYKQTDSTPRYNGRDVAVMRSLINQAVTVLGSATPSVESYYNAETGKYRLLRIPERIDNAKMPKILIVDFRKEKKEKLSTGSISSVLREKINERLLRKESTILLRNRRGFSTYLLCGECGYVEMCPNCDLTLIFHKKKKHLRCHYCGFVKEPPVVCPRCSSANLYYGGTGTQKVEEELSAIFPEAKILRMDLDTTSKKGAHDKILSEFASGDVDILIGTQLVAKGLDFPKVTLVGVISADDTMLLPDFRSNERAFQLLTQVSGRAGRRDKEGEVVIQVRTADNPILDFVIRHDYKSFYQKEIEFRKELSYPPFTRMAVIEFRGRNLASTSSAAEMAAKKMKKKLQAVSILGPSPAVITRLMGKFRYQILLKLNKSFDSSNEKLKRVLDEIDMDIKRTYKNSVVFYSDVDPISTL
ncbi:MAG: primosomal protein N' [Candidatus Kryptoniota bacterium]